MTVSFAGKLFERFRAAPGGACPFAQCSKITTTCAPVNRFCRSFLWLSRMGKSFVTHCNAIVTGL